MQIVETTILETKIRIRIADQADLDEATQWIEFEIPLAPLKTTDQRGTRPLGNLGEQYLSVIRTAALLYVREIIDAEIRHPVTPQVA